MEKQTYTCCPENSFVCLNVHINHSYSPLMQSFMFIWNSTQCAFGATRQLKQHSFLLDNGPLKVFNRRIKMSAHGKGGEEPKREAGPGQGTDVPGEQQGFHVATQRRPDGKRMPSKRQQIQLTQPSTTVWALLPTVGSLQLPKAQLQQQLIRLLGRERGHKQSQTGKVADDCGIIFSHRIHLHVCGQHERHLNYQQT